MGHIGQPKRNPNQAASSIELGRMAGRRRQVQVGVSSAGAPPRAPWWLVFFVLMVDGLVVSQSLFVIALALCCPAGRMAGHKAGVYKLRQL